jgi:flagellar biosynthetic protein FliQ
LTPQERPDGFGDRGIKDLTRPNRREEAPVSTEFVIDFGRKAMELILLLSLPMLLVGLVIGLVVSVFQATTQIQEMTLQFIPKIVCISLVVVIAGPWLLDKLLEYTEMILVNFPDWVRSASGLVTPGIEPADMRR